MDTDTADNDKIINCPQCRIKNPIESDICYNCGTSLHEMPAKKKSRPWLPVIICILFIVSVLYFYYRSNPSIPPPSKTQTASTDKPSAARPQAKPPPKTSLVRPDPGSEIDAALINIPIGLLRIKDIAGNVMSEMTVPIVGGGWVALPTRISLGGSNWLLQMSSGNQLEIEGGLINDLDQISLWRIREDLSIAGPNLYPWSADKPLTWLALRSPDPPEPIEIGGIERQGNFYKSTMPDAINDSGVFIQDDRVVGWSFGDSIDGAFLWSGDEGRNLKAEIRVDDYYRLTFGNSREEEFALALTLGDDYSDLDKLEAFTQAFRFESKLSVQQTPDYLQPDVIISQLRSLIARAVQNGFAIQAANYFDAEVLAQADDISLMSDVVILTAESYGFEEAVNLTEDVIENVAPKNDREKIQLAKLHSGLYQNWLSAMLEGGAIQEAWQVYERGGRQRPDDLDIHLFGVKLALAENDWATAEELLSAKDYPPDLRDQVRSLKSQISELKGQQGKIVIRFVPGTQQIPVSASLNQGTSQDFIVDTGASMTTIPSSTAADLGITITVRNPRRTVYTAGGVLYAPEVIIGSINVEGFEMNNVKALVLDLPNQPDTGLLGMNYLRRFRMDLNTDEGILLLAPK
ncbi:MAG: TIGR02281 family clan AA aspartic protease [Desulfobacterales bacterium]|jgi:clan AA aspartic protease (TIGR02281 family)